MRSSRWPDPFLAGFFLRPSAARPMRAFSSFRFFILLWAGGATGGWFPPPSSSSAAASAPRLASLRPGRGYRRSAGPRPLLPRRPRGGTPGPATSARPARAMAAPSARPGAFRPFHLPASRVPIGRRGTALLGA